MMITRNQTKIKTVLTFTLVAMAMLTASANAAITFDGFMSWQPTSALGTFDASGSDKLVVVVSGEHNFNQSAGGQVNGVTYDGQTLIKAVDVDPKKIDEGGHGDTATDIWYLDNPGSYHTAGLIAASVSGNGNNYVYTAIGLSGTAEGVGPTATAPGAATVDLNVTASGSMVIFNIGMGGGGNTASPLPGVTANSPAGAVTIDGLEAGNNWAGHAVARASISTPGLQTFSFDTTKTDVATIAAAFEPSVPPGPTDPSPADGATVPVGNVELSWTNMDPNNPADLVYVDVWFGTEPNELNPGYDMTKVLTADPNGTTVTVIAPVAGTYYWQVNSYIYGAGHINEPNMIEGPLWSFNAVDDVAPSSVDAGVDMITWSGEPVPLDATVVDDGKSALTYAWSANPSDGVVFNPSAAVEDPTITITKAPGDAATVTLTLAVNDEGNPTPVEDSMTIDVYDDACAATRIGLDLADITDFDENCITDLKDLAEMLATWLVDNSLTAPVPQ